MRIANWTAISLVPFLFFSLQAEAQDKNQYSVFAPTPAAQLREFSPDTPDKTEGPFTVDAGHIQIETEIVSSSREHHDEGVDETTRSYAIGETNFKLGLTSDLDAELIVSPYEHRRVRDNTTGDTDTSSGFGDMTARLKYNFWGNDGGDTALGLIPFVKFPTNTDNLGNSSIEGGLILPFDLSLPYDFDLGVMTEIDVNRKDEGNGHAAEFINSASLSRELIDHLEGYTELWTAKSTETDARWQATFDTGLIYKVSENLHLDAGINIGLTNSAEDANPFLGISWRY